MHKKQKAKPKLGARAGWARGIPGASNKTGDVGAGYAKRGDEAGLGLFVNALTFCASLVGSGTWGLFDADVQVKSRFGNAI